jgi:uncharacterized membrane protein
MPKTINDLAARWLRRTGALTEAESRVLQAAIERKTLARDLSASYAAPGSLGERLADAMARIGGSWNFILCFVTFLAFWALLNAWLLGRDSFDPYPFIFLNLVLSMLAAVQAPIIMMSQNRQAARDRLDAAHDYEVNLKAEIEIMALHEKLDELRHSEIIGLRDDVSRIAARLEEIAARLPSDPRRQ